MASGLWVCVGSNGSFSVLCDITGTGIEMVAFSLIWVLYSLQLISATRKMDV